MQLKKGDTCRVRLHTGEVVEAVYVDHLAYSHHAVEREGEQLITVALNRHLANDTCRFVGPSCDHVDIVPMGVSV